MATFNSQQLALIANQAGGDSTKSIPANERRVRSMKDFFNFNTTDETTSGTLADGDSIRLVKLLKGSKVFGIRFWFEAMGTNMVADFGLEGVDGSGFIDAAGTVADDVDFFTTAQISVAAIGEADAGVLQEDNPGYVLEKDCYLTLATVDSVGSVAWAANKNLDGYIEYIPAQ